MRSPLSCIEDVDAIKGCARSRGSLGDSLKGGSASNCKTQPGSIAFLLLSMRTQGEALTRELTDRARMWPRPSIYEE